MRTSTALVLVIATVTSALVGGPLWTGSTGERFHFVVWGMPFEDRLFEDGYARDFETLHPGLEVRYDRYPDVNQKYYAWHLRGTGADVMRLTLNNYRGMVQRGLLEPIDGWLDDPLLGLSASVQADFPPSVWEALQVDGHRYALPSDHNLNGLYWNRTLFEAFNEAHPDDPVPLPSEDWTWETLAEVAERLTLRDADGRVVQHGLDFALHARHFHAFLAQAGGRAWDDTGARTLVASEAGAEALRFMLSLLSHTPSVRATSSSHSATGPDKVFASGRTAMLLDGSWRAPALQLASPDLDFAIAPLPGHERRASIGTSVLWAVSVHAEDKDLAWEMVRWMTSEAQSLRYWDTLRVAPPARLSVVRSPDFERTRGIREGDEVLVPAMPAERFEDWGAWLRQGLLPDPDTGLAPAFVVAGEYQRDLDRALRQAISRAASPSSTATAEEVLKEVAVQVHGIIDRDRKGRGLPPVQR